MLRLMVESVWCLCCWRRCEKAHDWRGNNGPTQEGLEVASLMQSLCTAMVMLRPHEVEFEWSESKGCLTIDGEKLRDLMYLCAPVS
jgi:hypothetical protein